MNDSDLKKLNELIDQEQTDKFYDWTKWKKLRLRVMEMDHNECQVCKAKGRYSKGAIVHHVKHLKERPDLALSIFDGEERQLITVCKQCHEDLHPEQLKRCYMPNKKTFSTVERWD